MSHQFRLITQDLKLKKKKWDVTRVNRVNKEKIKIFYEQVKSLIMDLQIINISSF